ncbi:MAG TPA: carboxylating nicotinate-nucleotide diphosphorylase [Ignavibacteriaceae bacterium]|nr:carboxylating nicotinate-nucleotide diphosphorylase [Ignavibacteriaceae bacterium]
MKEIHSDMKNKFDKIIKNALKEDIRNGDITTSAAVKNSLYAHGEFLAKQEGVIAGLDVAGRVFQLVDGKLNFKKFLEDGSRVEPGKFFAEVRGKASSILTAERTALNFLQRMSGIATAANLFSEKIKHTKAKILDTRKTAPGLRLLDKLAVYDGGGTNHRYGLYDLFLIKDNHITAAGSITKAVKKCVIYRKKKHLNTKIEVEAANLNDVEEALSCNADIIMLDNFTLDNMKKAVDLISGKCLIEASGMVNLENVKEIAETGVDFISVGYLTHSVKALDISLNIKL